MARCRRGDAASPPCKRRASARTWHMSAVLFEKWLGLLNRSKLSRMSPRVTEMTQPCFKRRSLRFTHHACNSDISLVGRALSITARAERRRFIDARSPRGVFAVRQRIATWLFLSHTGKSPRSSQQFAAIGKLINFQVRIGTSGVNAQAAEVSRFKGSSLRSPHA
jgi:hypothetical protein